MLRSFQDTLAAAIEDVTDHGFDSMERIQRWTRELELAAERQAGDPEMQAQQLRDALAAIYKRNVDDLELLRHHEGEVPRFTIEKVRPRLRAELDRRIQASAELIKRNRKQAIEETLQRFQGWSTSIPPGGAPAEKKSEIKANQRKALKQLPFEERRVLIDQGHKLVSALSEIVAADGGAIAGEWRSHWRQAGYDYREDHKERDGKFYAIRDSWAHRAGLMGRGGRPWYDEIDAPGQAVLCSCYMIWLYNLRDIPDDMLTRNGRRAMVEVGQHASATRAFARADSAAAFPDFFRGLADPVPPAAAAVPRAVVEHVMAFDRMGYCQHVRGLEFVPDRDRWHGQEEDGVITLEEKFRSLPAVEQAHVLMHEVGHVGQEADSDAWSAFKAANEGALGAFLAMANPAHLDDYRRNGHVDGGMAPEVFAESYARYCLGLPLPSRLADFWRSRSTGLLAQRDARYMPWWPNKPTRCQRCSMFLTGLDPLTNGCTAVAGPIASTGHCKLFQIRGARADSAEDDWPAPKVGYAAHRLRLDRLELKLARRREKIGA